MSRTTAEEFRAYQAALKAEPGLTWDDWRERQKGGSLSEGEPASPARRPSIPAQRCEADGFKFQSKTERDRYEYLKLLPEVVHIDVHPVLTLSTGRRWTADFLVWEGDPGDEFTPPSKTVRVEEVKGHTAGDAWRRFTLVREDFDKHHPLAPLRCIVRDGKGGWCEA